MAQLIEQLIQKMGLNDEPKVIGKTKELLRLLELRSTNVNATLNEYAKTVLCIDLAAVFLGLQFDQENALKLSNLRKTQYANNKRLLEKLLDLNKLVGVNEICTKLGINEVSKKSTELLELYKNTIEKETTDIDIAHPQYAAMAVYQACKMSQKRISKAKILSLSHLRPSQWAQLEVRWDKVIAGHYSKVECKKMDIDKPGTNREKEGESEKSVKSIKRSKVPDVEDYEVWKRRMLAMSQMQLSLDKDNTKNNKENLIKLRT